MRLLKLCVLYSDQFEQVAMNRSVVSSKRKAAAQRSIDTITANQIDLLWVDVDPSSVSFQEFIRHERNGNFSKLRHMHLPCPVILNGQRTFEKILVLVSVETKLQDNGLEAVNKHT